MAVNVTREYLLANGISADLIDRILAENTAHRVASALARGDASAPFRPRPGLPVPVLARVSGGDGWWEAEFRDWSPVSKNSKSGHWSAWQRMRRRDNAAVALWRQHPAGPPLATGKRRVSCRIVRGRIAGRRPDPQNVEESLYDSIVACGLLVDDSGRWCERGPTVIDVDRDLACKVVTRIRLEEKS